MEALKLYKSTKSLVGLQEFEDFKSTLNENSGKINKLEETVSELTRPTHYPYVGTLTMAEPVEADGVYYYVSNERFIYDARGDMTVTLTLAEDSSVGDDVRFWLQNDDGYYGEYHNVKVEQGTNTYSLTLLGQYTQGVVYTGKAVISTSSPTQDFTIQSVRYSRTVILSLPSAPTATQSGFLWTAEPNFTFDNTENCNVTFTFGSIVEGTTAIIKLENEEYGGEYHTVYIDPSQLTYTLSFAAQYSPSTPNPTGVALIITDAETPNFELVSIVVSGPEI